MEGGGKWAGPQKDPPGGTGQGGAAEAQPHSDRGVLGLWAGGWCLVSCSPLPTAVSLLNFTL